LLILIDNAAKYTPPGGAVSVSVEAQGGFARAWVSDTGFGIAEDDLAQVFDRFWRADKACSREQGGTSSGITPQGNAPALHIYSGWPLAQFDSISII
jgi:signal transduction histidine kinase